MNGVDIVSASLDSKCTLDISNKEKASLEHVLLNYSFSVLLIEKVRGVYKVHTNNGLFCLKRLRNGYHHAKKSYYLSEHLRRSGFNNIAEYVETAEGKLLLKHKKYTYYLTKWIDADEISNNTIEDILESTLLLARFHCCAKGMYDISDLKMRSKYGKLKKEYKNCLEDMKKYRKIISKKHFKTDFEIQYMNSIEEFSEEIRYSTQILEHTRYSEMCRLAGEERYICHDRFYNRNILKSLDGQLYLVDFESCKLDLPIVDLGRFIRRIIVKRDFLWDLDICRQIIDSYNNIKPLEKEEYKLLLSIIIFPKKFCKLGKKRFIKKKDWPEQKFVRKLKRLVFSKDCKEEFIEGFKQLYGLDIPCGETDQ